VRFSSVGKDPQSDSVYDTWVSLATKERGGGYGSLSAAERVFYGVYLLDLEVYNGGFLQYLGNTEGRYAGDLVGALKTIGANETATRVEQFFNKVFPNGIPDDADARRDLAFRVEDEYEQRFRPDEDAVSDWYCKDIDGIFHRLWNYARENRFLVE
jgi:Domain of unknown function (DUF4375)